MALNGIDKRRDLLYNCGKKTIYDIYASEEYMPTHDTILELAALAGTLIIRSGGETSRAEDTAGHIFAAASYPDSQISCQPTAVYLTLRGEGVMETTVARVGPRTIDLSVLSAVNSVSREYSEGLITADEALSRLKDLSSPREDRDRFSAFRRAAVYALATALSVAAFAVMFGGGMPEAIAAAIAGLLVSLIQSALHSDGRGFIDQFAVTIIGGAVISATAVTAGDILGLCSTDGVMIGAIMPLLPGLALTVSIRDTIVGDLVSGVARLAEVIMTGFALAGSIGAVMYLFMLMTGADHAGGLSSGSALSAAYILRLVVSGFAATLFYQLPWNSPKKAVVPAAAVGAVCYAVFALLKGAGMTYLGYFAASLLAAVSAEILAKKLRMPSTLFIFPGLIPLVPGIGLYESMLCVVRGETVQARSIGAEVMICAALMAFAVAVEGAVTGRISGRPKKR